MDVQTEVYLEPLDRVEVLAGPTGRRTWPDEVKGRLVAESFMPGVTVREVAERNGLMPNRLSTWRGLARRGSLVVPDLGGAEFATVVWDDAAPTAADLKPPPDDCSASTYHPMIELETGGVTVRFDADTDMRRVADLVLAVKTAP